MVLTDLKPDNLMTDTEGEVKVIDLGGIKTIKNSKYENLLITPIYAPPEYMCMLSNEYKLNFSFGIFTGGLTILSALLSK